MPLSDQVWAAVTSSSAADAFGRGFGQVTKIVVTGASGFLGHATAQHLLSAGFEVVGLDIVPPKLKHDYEFRMCDVRDREALSGHLAGAEALAASFRRTLRDLGELQNEIARAIDVNIIGTTNVFLAAREAGVARVIHASKPNVWRNTYTITKSAAEEFGVMLSAHSNRSFPEITSVRIFNAYGPGQTLSPVRKLIPTFIHQAANGRAIEVWGNGDQTVDMVYSGDVAAVFADLMATTDLPAVVDLGSGCERTVSSIAVDISTVFGLAPKVRYLEMRSGETAARVPMADTAALRSILPNFQVSEWQASLEETVSWYLDGPWRDEFTQYPSSSSIGAALNKP